MSRHRAPADRHAIVALLLCCCALLAILATAVALDVDTRPHAAAVSLVAQLDDDGPATAPVDAP